MGCRLAGRSRRVRPPGSGSGSIRHHTRNRNFLSKNSLKLFHLRVELEWQQNIKSEICFSFWFKSIFQSNRLFCILFYLENADIQILQMLICRSWNSDVCVSNCTAGQKFWKNCIFFAENNFRIFCGFWNDFISFRVAIAATGGLTLVVVKWSACLHSIQTIRVRISIKKKRYRGSHP